MTLEKRKNKHYYYHKHRENGHVISAYLGTTLPAEFAALDQLEAQINQSQEHIAHLTRAVLLVNGYHTHHRQWRKKSDKRNPTLRPHPGNNDPLRD